jgi:cytoskeletal protein RodZ
MKLTNIRKSKKILLTTVVIVALATATLVVFSIYYNQENPEDSVKNSEDSTSIPQSNENTIDETPPTTEQEENANEIKGNNTQNSESTLDSSVTAVVSGEILRVQTNISDLSTSGSCTLTVTSDASGERRFFEADTQQLSSYSTCKGFDIPLSNLDSGKLLINLTYSSPNGDANSSTEITI